MKFARFFRSSASAFALWGAFAATPLFAQESQDAAAQSVRFEIDATRPGKIIGNKVAVVNLWSLDSLAPSAKDEGCDLSFVERVQLMQSTGGSEARELFKDPNDGTVRDDYDFSKMISACRTTLELGAKPHIKFSVPSKFSTETKRAAFGVDVYPPDDFDDYYRFVRALTKALVDEFGRDEVRSWRFGVLTEFENADWFQAVDGTPESSREAFFKLYEHNVAALIDELGPGICVGAHAMACTEGLWDERDFLERCAKGVNSKTGEIGTPLSYFAISFYDDAPDKPHPLDLPGTISRIREKAESVGLTDLLYGVDEGRILYASKGANAADLTFRIVGQTYQAAYDARMFKILIDADVEYFSAWSYSSGNAWQGYPTIAQPVAVGVAKFKDSRLLPTTAEKTLADGVDVDAVAGFDEATQTVRITAFNFKFDLEYAEPVDLSFALSVPFWAGKKVEIVEKVVDDRSNFFLEWQKDKARLNIPDSVFPWSPDSANLDSAIYDPDAKTLYYNELRPKYVEIANRPLPTETRVETVPENGELNLSVRLARHGVVFYDVKPVAE